MNRWRFNKQINLSVLVELLLLASLILGSWINLQRQLDKMQRDITETQKLASVLLDNQQNFERKLEIINERSIGYEYRLQALENRK